MVKYIKKREEFFNKEIQGFKKKESTLIKQLEKLNEKPEETAKAAPNIKKKLSKEEKKKAAEEEAKRIAEEKEKKGWFRKKSPKANADPLNKDQINKSLLGLDNLPKSPMASQNFNKYKSVFKM